MKKVIGITGGISSGKSLVSNYIKNKGYKVIDADIVSRELIYKNSVASNEILKQFGEEYFTFGELDRKKLGQAVFGDKFKLMMLNNIMHPLIKQKIKEEIDLSDGIIFIDVPLLYEDSYDKLCDSVILVYTTPSIQLKRLMARDNIDREYAAKKISSQMSLEHKKELANYIIYNIKDIDYCYNQIDTILKEIKE